MKGFFTAKRLCRAGIIAALYVALTYSFGAIASNGFLQIRPAEAPVSYTHLDVYKRQLMTLPPPPAAERIKSQNTTMTRTAAPSVKIPDHILPAFGSAKWTSKPRPIQSATHIFSGS